MVEVCCIRPGESATIHFPMPLPTEIAAAVAAFKIEDNGVPVNVRDKYKF